MEMFHINAVCECERVSGGSQAAAGTETLVEGCDSRRQITRRSASLHSPDFGPFGSHLREKMFADLCTLLPPVSES